jgi:hypothetical protein
LILLSLLTKRFPFFPQHDQHDMTALMQVAALVGENELRQAAKACGKEVLDFPEQAKQWPAFLDELCQSASQRGSGELLCSARQGGVQSSPKKKGCRKGAASLAKCAAKPKGFCSGNVPGSGGASAELMASLRLLRRCLDPNPHSRVSAAGALESEFLFLSAKRG